jgi:parallel beta-helix repeat protein
VALVGVVSQPAEAAPLVLYVNATGGTDTGTCAPSTTPCATISYALTQAALGATIFVANGTYPEQLRITQSVSIVGATITSTVIKPTTLPLSDTDPDSATPQKYIVDVAPNTTGVHLKNLSIAGSAASSTFTSCANNYVGVYFHDSSGHLGKVRVTGIGLPTSLAGCKHGLGVYVASDSGSTSSVTMLDMGISSYQHTGIACDDPGTTCTIATSKVTGSGPTSTISQNGIQMFGASGSISDVRVINNTYTGGGAGNEAIGVRLLNVGTVTVVDSLSKANDIGIYAAEIPADGLVPPTTGTWTIKNNKTLLATDRVPGGAAGYGNGISIDSTSNSVQVTGNTARGDAGFGFALYGAVGVNLLSNTATLDHDGFYVGGPGSAAATSSGNTIKSNVAQLDHNDGLLADVVATESGNTFAVNSSRSNVTAQIVDLSHGVGTAGTANIWTANRCRGGPHGSPAGLC